ARQPGVRTLDHAGRIQRRLTFLRIEIDVEMRGLDDLEVEGPVLDLVAAEMLGRRSACTDREDSDHDRDGSEETSHHELLPLQASRTCAGASPQRRSSW